MYIDTHCHLTFQDFDEDRSMVIGNAKKAGVKQFIVPGVDLLSSRLSVELSTKHPNVVFSAVGFHPYEAQHLPNVHDLKPFIGETVVAIGECGLDYHLYKGEEAKSKKTNQIRLFDEHCKLAIEYNLPMIIHCRDAFDDLFSVLDSQPSLPRGVLHCFSGGTQELRMAAARKLFVGLDGNVTYSKKLQFMASLIPLSMLLLETDAPYLTPEPHRGTRNEPKYLPLVAKTIAIQQNIPQTTVAQHTTENAKHLFNLP
ncbi:MAG: TatD family hydrolase [Patescibacteria group bacterium]|nr:TatD family hydrolase [Patescibacteria group bacterium]